MAIVVSHIASDFDTLCQRALRQVPLADVVELRLDRIGHPGKERLAEFLKACPKPVIIACHGAEAYGEFPGTAEEVFDLYQDAAEVGARFVDIDYRLSLDLGEVEAPCHRIVSRHELEGTPYDLDARLEEIQEVLYEGDVTKLVTHAHSCEDGLRLLRWLRTTKGIVAFCAGEEGRFTRILAPIFGSPFTYCAAAEVPGGPAGDLTAPGQIRVNDYLALLPPGGLSQETAVFGVVGRPARHSWSPWVHGMALKAAKLDAVFVALEPETLAGLLALADDENYRGFSITAPFKQEAHALVARRDEASERTGAVNTLVRDKEGWRAGNTDVGAVRDTLDKALRYHARDARAHDGAAAGPAALSTAHALILGTGGAARAAAWAIKSVGGRVTLTGRSPERAQALAAELDCEHVAWAAIPELEYDVLVHATPVGSFGGEAGLPIPADWIRQGTVVFDAVYRPIRTELLLAARDRDCTPIPGGEWFVRQAVAQFRLFTSVEPDEALMRKAFEHAHETQGART